MRIVTGVLITLFVFIIGMFLWSFFNKHHIKASDEIIELVAVVLLFIIGALVVLIIRGPAGFFEGTHD